ncbi:MAG: DNA primase, partial [Proteobacteria bacterium]|nr:DNA primase [Pseudomonadota bacterium]
DSQRLADRFCPPTALLCPVSIPRDIVEAVRDRADIVEVVSRHVSLVQRGSNFVGLCPFHQEKTASFNVVPSKRIFHCFGCSKSGDVFGFLMSIEGVSFVEAVKDLARTVGIDVPERELTPAEKKALRRRAGLLELLEVASETYTSVLWTHKDGEKGRQYLQQRGFDKEAALGARLGFSPGDGWTRLIDAMQRKGFSIEQCCQAGLARENKRGNHYDTFRNRLLFPIRDERSRVIGFGGRLIDGEGPKYINTPETKFYEKSKVLYGLDTAVRAIQRAAEVLIVEGYFDVLAMQQAGFPQTVATCGTALTMDHLQRIRRLTNNVLVVTDADEAGAAAAEKMLPLFLHAKVIPWRVSIPGAKDPDELVQQEGPEAMVAAIEAKVPLVDWVVERKMARGGGLMGRDALIEEMVPLLAMLPPQAVSRFAGRLGHEPSILKRVAEYEVAPPSRPALPPTPASSWRPQRQLVHVIWLLVHHHQLVAWIIEQVGIGVFAEHRAITHIIERLLNQDPVASIIEQEDDPSIKRTLSAIVARDTLYTAEQAQMGMCQVLNQITQPQRQVSLTALANEMDRANRDGDDDQFLERALERQQILSRDKALDKALRQNDIESWLAEMTGNAISGDMR